MKFIEGCEIRIWYNPTQSLLQSDYRIDLTLLCYETALSFKVMSHHDDVENSNHVTLHFLL